MKKATLLFLLILSAFSNYSQDLVHDLSITRQTSVLDKWEEGAFPIVFPAASSSTKIGAGSAPDRTSATNIFVDENDHWLVKKAASLLQEDIERVTGCRPVVVRALPQTAENLIIIGSLDRSPLVGRLAAHSRKLADSLKGKWEAWSMEIVDRPAKGISRALVIAGSDRRGAAYGVFELSKQIGVSPWYWWADVPASRKKELYLRKGTGEWSHPAVKYRGFFINDEAPALSGWAHKKFGGLNHAFYEHVFELLLRMKANFLWPAMWGNAFNDDDTLNPVLADKYGIVMGTSHHEPMLRAQQEWKRYGSGPWNYSSNEDTLRAFWKKGIEHMDSHESIVTIGMRGDGDMPMTEGSNIALLERIVHDQRGIIQSVTGKDPAAVPQAWALYKEVQEYYDRGMRVPDDVTLLLCDDNWGNVRKLPAPGEKTRAGGYGMYYHFDYVGDPRNYKWVNTNAIERVWEQMHLTWQYGVDRIWIVNVGDIKPMEFPIEFFLDYAWDPVRWPAERLMEYGRQWAARQFSPEHASVIAEILTKYTRYNGRCKPELLSPETYSLLHYREWETVVADYNTLAKQADSINQLLPANYRDAYYQLVLYPVQACANLNDLYFTVAKNRLYAAQGRAATNGLADRARELYDRDSILSRYYNKEMAGGKWDHMMDQTHIGYTYWQQPLVNSMPEIKRAVSVSAAPVWGVSIEGDSAWWPGANSMTNTTDGKNATPAILPVFDPYGEQSHYLEIFSRTKSPINYTLETDVPWLRITSTTSAAATDLQERLWVSVDWKEAPAGSQQTRITITGPDGKKVQIDVPVNNPAKPKRDEVKGFIETNGYISMEAEHYSRAMETSIKWQRISGLGRTKSGMTTTPVTARLPSTLPGGNSPHLEYDVHLFDTGTVTVQAFFSPTLDFSTNGLRYGISFDEEPPKILDLHVNPSTKAWEIAVANNIFIIPSRHRLTKPGKHVLKFWMVDPGVVLQKLVVDAGGVKPSYLGPPETIISTTNQGLAQNDLPQKGLKDFYQTYFPIGVAVSPKSLSGPDSALILQQFNSLTPENAMKMGPIHPEENRYYWKDADAIVSFAQAHGLKVRGHNLCWHEQTPDWLFVERDQSGKGTGLPSGKGNKGSTITKDVLLKRLKDHITTVVDRYKGKIYAWDVVNEAIDDDSTKFLRNSLWYQICGEDFITKAFEYAHQADPEAQLFYNDYNTERPEKRERVYKLLKRLTDAGVPVSGVGLQGHWSIFEPSESELQETIERFASLGLKVQITELDMSVYPWEKNKRARRPGESDSLTPDLEHRQTLQYKKIFQVFRDFKKELTGVTFWNVTDKNTWLDSYPVPGRKNYPLLFDTRGFPKKAYWEVVNF